MAPACGGVASVGSPSAPFAARPWRGGHAPAAGRAGRPPAGAAGAAPSALAAARGLAAAGAGLVLAAPRRRGHGGRPRVAVADGAPGGGRLAPPPPVVGAELAPLTPELAVALCRRPEKAKAGCWQPSGGPAATPAAAAKQLVSDAVGLALEAPEGGRRDAQLLLKDALLHNDQRNLRLFNVFQKSDQLVVKQLAQRSLEQYFKLEDPTKVSAACRGIEITVQVPVGDVEAVALRVPCVDRVDMAMDGDTSVLTLVDYGMGDREEEEEELERMKLQAWALKECQEFDCDLVAVRRLDLLKGVAGAPCTLSGEDLERARRLAADAARQYLSAVSPDRPTTPWAGPLLRERAEARPEGGQEAQEEQSGQPAVEAPAKPKKAKAQEEQSQQPVVEAPAKPKKAKAKPSKTAARSKKQKKASGEGQDEQPVEAKASLAEPAEGIAKPKRAKASKKASASAAEGEGEGEEKQSQKPDAEVLVKPKKAKATKAAGRPRKQKKEKDAPKSGGEADDKQQTEANGGLEEEPVEAPLPTAEGEEAGRSQPKKAKAKAPARCKRQKKGEKGA